jgi:enolase
MSAKIKDIKSSEIIDSRGKPTIKTTIILENGISGVASVPSGASTGSHEACELRDQDPKRFNGYGVLKAIANIESDIKPLIIGLDVDRQNDLDQAMISADGTKNKSGLGANAILSVSLAICKAAANDKKLPLYEYIRNLSGNTSAIANVTPIFNVINGGLHGNGKIPFQEFILMPNPKIPFIDAYRMGVELYANLKTFLKKNGLDTSIGDEGGFTPNVESNTKALELLKSVIESSVYKYANDVFIGLDLAASTYFQNGNYKPELNLPFFDAESYINYLTDIKMKFNLFSMEDPLAEDDWDNWTKLTQKIGNNTMIIGDDLLVTNLERLEKGINTKAINSILIKVNQIGTLTETIKVVNRAKESGLNIVISHRSGETNEDFIADLAVGCGAGFLKSGAPVRGERIAKYNRLKEIYETL